VAWGKAASYIWDLCFCPEGIGKNKRTATRTPQKDNCRSKRREAGQHPPPERGENPRGLTREFERKNVREGKFDQPKTRNGGGEGTREKKRAKEGYNEGGGVFPRA